MDPKGNFGPVWRIFKEVPATTGWPLGRLVGPGMVQYWMVFKASS